MAPHVEMSSNFLLGFAILAVVSLLWMIGTTLVIFTFTLTRIIRKPHSILRDRYLHVMIDRLSYLLLLTSAVLALLWEVYHLDVEQYGFPIHLRLWITIPAMILGDYASWKAICYRLHLDIRKNRLKKIAAPVVVVTRDTL